MNLRLKHSTLATGAAVAAILLLPTLGFAQTGLGAAASYAVLAGSTITNTGATTVSGDMGVSPGTSVVGIPLGQPTPGTVHAGDLAAAQAQSDLGIAYGFLASMPCNVTRTGVDLGGTTLTSGVYCFASSAFVTGTLTLDAQGDSAAVFVFQIGSTLAVTDGSSVILANGAQPSHVWWQVGSSATLGIGSKTVGNVLAYTSISLNTGASITGRLLAEGGAVTMGANSVAIPGGTGTLGVAPRPGRSVGLRLDVAPMPAVTSTVLRWTLPSSGRVWLEVLDLQGRRTAMLVDGEMLVAGNGMRQLDTQGWQPGVYLARLRTSDGSVVRRIVVKQ